VQRVEVAHDDFMVARHYQAIALQFLSTSIRRRIRTADSIASSVPTLPMRPPPVFDEITKSRGWVSNAMASMSHAPEGLRRFAAVGDYARYRTELTERQRELAIVSIGRAVPYAVTHHGALAVQAGIPKDAVDDILAAKVPVTLAQEDRALVKYVLEFGSSTSVSDATFAELKKHFSERAITDITLVAAYYLALGTMLNGFKVELEPPAEREVEMLWQKVRADA
jgi:alkylhydroperoxidase family enzyme